MYIHTVKQNDTVWSIARQYGVSAERIVTDNGLENVPYLVVGQALLILVPEITHMVRSGESLYTVSKDYSVTEDEILQRNPNLINSSALNPGEEIVISYMGEGNKIMPLSGYAYPNVNIPAIKNILPYATKCAIFSYGFSENASLIPPDDETLINLCLRYSADPIMVISSIDESGNFSNSRALKLFHDEGFQERVLAQTVQTMKQRGYRGLDIDFEYVGAKDREAYTNFVKNACNLMHKNGFAVNVDLAPKTSSEQSGTLYEGHDYKALSQYADTVLLMTYEWGYTYGPPMAVAPVNQVRRVVEYAVKEIERKKIFLGIPNYAYDWSLPYEKGKTAARAVSNETAVLIASENGARIEFDTEAAAPFFEYFSNGIKHVVWFEDVRSIRAKFNLADEYALGGVGIGIL